MTTPTLPKLPPINWTQMLAVGGTAITGILTIVAAVPQSPVAALVPPQYAPLVIAGGALATAILHATAAHQSGVQAGAQSAAGSATIIPAVVDAVKATQAAATPAGK